MKVSKYNIFLEDEANEEGILSYNSLTGAMALIEYEKYNHLKDFELKGIEIPDKKFSDDLFEGGFIINDDVDELKLLKLNLLQSRYRTGNLGLTIATTLACNFRCVYCYEKKARLKGEMSKEIQKDIIEFVKSKIKHLSSLSITWYGGEPLCAWSVIENLSRELIRLCEENDVAYDANIITNGYLLTKDIAKKLTEFKVKNVQITIDGPKEIHDKRRFLADGSGTYDKIMANLKECSRVLEQIGIRINTDIENIDRVKEIIQTLNEFELQSKTHITLGFVESINNSYKKEKCFEYSDFQRKQVELVKEGVLKPASFYPQPRFNYCGADSGAALVIDPEGKLYKCWCDIGVNEKIIGDIKNLEKIRNMEVFTDYMLYDPTEDEECQQCICLPFCKGGCPHKRLVGDERCDMSKENLKLFLKMCAYEIMNRKEDSNEG